MPKICYVPKNFRDAALATIITANRIIEEFQAQGFKLTLRQLYYQFVARDLIPNIQKEYNKLGTIVNDGRLAGLINWKAIEDRTRNLQSLAHWSSPASIIQSAATSYRIDKWERQPYRIEVWIEKDALVGVLERVCKNWDVAYFSCRGYNSQSEMWGAAQRLINYSHNGQRTLILHLGDHDPSGLDMTRDIRDRLNMFMNYEGVQPVSVERIALNADQIAKYNPPPNPAKLTDSRAHNYIVEHGANSWELDALEPRVIEQLIQKAVEDVVDMEIYQEDQEIEAEQKGHLVQASNRWDEVEQFLED
jgi:hypothetical protein